MVGAAEQAASWLRGVGVTWDDGAVEIRVHVGSSSSGGADASNAAPAAAQLAGATFPGYSGKAMGVWAVRDIKEGESLCRIPKKALLSIRNTEASDIIEEEDLGGGLGLVFAVLYEMCLAEKSRWHGYFQSMPEREYLPLFWTQEELGLLVGTDLGERAVADRLAPCATRPGICLGLSSMHGQIVPSHLMAALTEDALVCLEPLGGKDTKKLLGTHPGPDWPLLLRPQGAGAVRL